MDVLFDNWLYMDGEAREALNQNDIYTTDQLCEKSFSEIKDIVGNDAAKKIKADLAEHQYYLKNSDYSVNQKRRFSLEAH